MEFARAGFGVLGFDVSRSVVEGLNQGRSHVQDVASADVARFAQGGKVAATAGLAPVRGPDGGAVWVPTPLSQTKDPDGGYVLARANSIKQGLGRGPPIPLETD